MGYNIAMFKDHKKAYGWFAAIMIILGGGIFVVSLITAMLGNKMDTHQRERVLYFDRKILPDHLFYPVLAAIDRMELEISNDEEKIVLKMEYAGKRLESAKALMDEGKVELGYVTLGKAHQYLLQANNDILQQQQERKYLNFVQDLNRKFMGEYVDLGLMLNDAQQNNLQMMAAELKVFQEAEASNEMSILR